MVRDFIRGYYEYKYPKAGQKNSKVSVHSYSVVTKDTKEMKVPVEGDFYIPRITFTQNPDQLAIMTLNRQQNVFNMYYANPKSGVFRLILREENKCYVDSDWLTSIQFLNNGFTYVSEQDGYSHIYLYSPTGVMQRQVTQGNWDVTAFQVWMRIRRLSITSLPRKARSAVLSIRSTRKA